jgi:hypothetical protein
MPLYGGRDRHANQSGVVLRNEHDQVGYHQRFPNHRPALLERLTPYRRDLEGVVVAATSHWYWLVEGWREADSRVPLANPAAMQP